ncbi:family 78 glycoside hydrolase catalytic domain [Paenibacillus sp. S3N08]|uniref:alpha-L-rhamnosidase n=1 Tax=Paenibacillus agricola TaxID=2716264 RepID=A0ABX0J7F5_9BACL|nr:family 78 glycoside hydrolase catalytic domain [Paenibacillus agricola]
MEIVAMTVEYEQEPLGLGELNPRFSWKLHSSLAGVLQSAYQIVVASDRSQLVLPAKPADMWDSGQVASGQSVLVEYEGSALASNRDYYWSVRIWNQDGEPSAWSEIGHWSMGLLKPSDWVAQWVTLGDKRGKSAVPVAEDGSVSKSEKPSLEGVHWICLPEAERKERANSDAYAGKMVYLRATVDIPAPISKAILTSTGDSRPLLFINGQLAHAGYNFRYPLHTDLTHTLLPGRNVLAYCLNESSSYGIGVNFGALCAKLVVETEDGHTLEFVTDPSWKISEEKPDGWNAWEFDDSSWLAAERSECFGSGPWGSEFNWPQQLYHPSKNENGFIRTSFELSKPIQRAYVYATALGVYELHVNGQKAGDQELAPGWTDYNQRLMVQAYDVTASLQQGENKLGLVVGPGWYAGCVAMFGPYQYGTRPYALAQLHILHSDGSETVIATDESWEWSQGSIQYSDLQQGEIHDARKEIADWCLPEEHSASLAAASSRADAGWSPVYIPELSPFQGSLTAQKGPVVRAMERLSPISVNEPKPGVFIFNLGQNIVGRAQLRVSGSAGTTVRMRFAEMMNQDGTLYIDSLRGARQTDIFILKGQGLEIFEPKFTFHGFQYVEITGYPGQPPLDCLTAIVLRSDTPLAGSLETSDPLLNQLISNIEWGQKDNFLSVPTDCPQRDERLGWTGDAQIFIRTASYNMNVGGFFSKWMDDVEDAQRESGAFTNVAPHLGWLESGIAAWGEAGVIVPWTVYRVYGDRRILERHYPAMERFIEFLKQDSSQWLRPDYGFGDWLSIAADTPKDVLATAYFAYSAHLMAQIAKVIGREADAIAYSGLFEQIRTAFQKAYVYEDGTIKGETQTVYLLALYMDLLPESGRQSAVMHLLTDIKHKGTHLSTGFVGVSYLLPMLSEHGYTDVAYELLQQESFPSWLYSVLQGATTIWERWDGWTLEHGPQKAVMNSFNHYSLGSVGEWLYRYMAGIDLPRDGEQWGFKRFTVKPHPGGRISSVKASFDSMYGTIHVQWETGGEAAFRLRVTVPANTEAEIWVPLAVDINTRIQVSGDSSLVLIGEEEGYAVYTARSGSFEFTRA